MSDENLMRGNPEFERLVDAHGAEIFAYLWRMLGRREDAEDCLQETYLRAYRAYPRLSARSNLRAWMYKIATNTARTHLKRRTRAAARALERELSSPQQELALSVQVEQRQRFAEVLEAIEKLPHKQRAALMLRKYHGLGYGEVAEALGCSPTAARANVYQGLRKLRALFATEGEPPEGES